MTLTVQIDDNESIQLTATAVETRPPDRVAVTAQGSLSVTGGLLEQFAGAQLNPIRVAVSSEGSDPVEIDLTEQTSLRLENVDIGVATPDGDDISNGLDAVTPSADSRPEPVDSPPDVVAFAVEGVISDVPAGTLEAIEDEAPRLESLTFAVEDSVKSDGGPGRDVVFELTLLGYGIVVHRDGTIVIGSSGPLASIELP